MAEFVTHWPTAASGEESLRTSHPPEVVKQPLRMSAELLIILFW